MSEQWQGLHNPNQHKRYKDECRCVGCGDYEWCASEYPCRCCLAAEVERLTAELASRNRRVEAALRVLDASQTDIAAELEHAVREALRGES